MADRPWIGMLPGHDYTRSLGQRLCGRITRHRWFRIDGPWRKGRNFVGKVWFRSEECRICASRFTRWTTDKEAPDA